MEAVLADGNGDWRLTWLEAITHMEILKVGKIPSCPLKMASQKTPVWLRAQALEQGQVEEYWGGAVQLSSCWTSQLHESKMRSSDMVRYFIFHSYLGE